MQSFEFTRLFRAVCLLSVWIVPNCLQGTQVQVWITDQRLEHRMSKIEPIRLMEYGKKLDWDILVDENHVFQEVLGLGASLEHSTCWNLYHLEREERIGVLKKLFDRDSGIGMNLMRICMGTPDFTGEAWYSYCDLPWNETDPDLKSFTIEKDRPYILPVLRDALAVNPDLLFFASPWSPPGWMKDNRSLVGGSLLPEFYPAYAQYFLNFIRAYEAEGIPIHAVTIQNEPGVDRAGEKDPDWFYPSCRWTADQERDFIRDHLGPLFERHAIPTKIWCYDHNYNETARGDDPGIDYPTTILSDKNAAGHVDGVAFHGYAGSPSGMSVFHRRFPAVPMYFTETSYYGVRGAMQIMELFHNHASSYNAWVTLLDHLGGPNNGPFEADLTCISLNPKTGGVDYQLDYYIYGHFMKFIQRGAKRILSEGEVGKIRHVAFRNPDGAKVLIVAGNRVFSKEIVVGLGNRFFRYSMPPQSVATFTWE